MPRLSDPSSIALLALSNRAFANRGTYKGTKVFFSDITTCVTNRFIRLEIHDMSRSFFPFILHYPPLALLFCNFLGFSSTPLIASKGNLEKRLK